LEISCARGDDAMVSSRRRGRYFMYGKDTINRWAAPGMPYQFRCAPNWERMKYKRVKKLRKWLDFGIIGA
jgi:hypothetical protein